MVKIQDLINKEDKQNESITHKGWAQGETQIERKGTKYKVGKIEK